MPRKKSIDQLSQSGLRTRLWRNRHRMTDLTAAEAQMHVNDIASAMKNKESKRIKQNIAYIGREVDQVLKALNGDEET